MSRGVPGANRPRCLGPELSAYADRTLVPDELRAWDRHLVACTGCRQAVESERRLLACLRAANGPEVPVSLRSMLLSLGSATGQGAEPTSPSIPAAGPARCALPAGGGPLRTGAAPVRCARDRARGSGGRRLGGRRVELRGDRPAAQPRGTRPPDARLGGAALGLAHPVVRQRLVRLQVAGHRAGRRVGSRVGRWTHCQRRPAAFGTIDAMSDQRDPGGESWDPWAPPSPPHGEPQAQPGAQPQAEGPGGVPHPGQPGAQGQPAGSHPGYQQDHTQPLDVSHTQSLHGEPAPQPAWTYDPQPPAHPGHEYQAWGAPAGAPAYPAYARGAGQGHDWTQAHHATTQATLNRRGPGWGALVGVAAVSALLAGLARRGGRGRLGSSDRLDFGHRSASSIPTVGAGATSRPEGSIANIAAKALPSVVTIQRRTAPTARAPGRASWSTPGPHHHQQPRGGRRRRHGGTIKVELSNGTEIDATIVGRDASYDLAVLKIGPLRPARR